MKQLVTLLVIVVMAVAVTLFAQGNASKVVVFFGHTRIDMSLNFVVIALVLLFVAVHFSLLAIRASSQLPGRFKAYLMSRKQTALLDADTRGVIALITGDELGSGRALKSALKTGLNSDLSHLIRALSCIQSDRLNEAEEVLARSHQATGIMAVARLLLMARIALARGQADKAVELLAGLDAAAARLPQAQHVRLFALIGLHRWEEALAQFRMCVADKALSPSDIDSATAAIYTGLTEQAGGDAVKVKSILSNAKPRELDNAVVLSVLSDALLAAGEGLAARLLLEGALKDRATLDVLPAYHQVAVHESRDALPFVENLVARHPTDLRLIELAGDVCEQEQLWGKAISRFETVYSKQPSPHLAKKLERVYTAANQMDKARVWRDKLNVLLGQTRQPA